jgi:DNA-directed RNA polymerase
VQWVKDNEENITRSAASPLDHLWWTDADEPWCFLAACMEYVGYLIEGDEYVSHLPIAMDGSCSGLQHYSAMLRDPRGAHATNLTATDKPTDLYTQVQEVVNQRLAESSEPLAKVWAGKVTRKIVKRPCMTFAYGVTSAGIKNQLLEELRKSSRDAVGKDDTFRDSYLPGVSNWESAVLLAPIIEQAIMEVVECAAEARDWLKSVSKQVSKAGVPTGWTTPLGFRVLQPYLKSRGKRIKVLFNGTVHFLSLTFEGDDIHSNEQSLGVSPNFVHSLDATHMMMTVNRLAPVTDSFAMIHDSFGVHACDVDELHYALRDEFIKLYEQDVLVSFYQESLLRVPGGEWPKVPSPPEAGEFNLEEVRDADFFFA